MVLVKLKTNDNVVFTVERTAIRKSKMIIDAIESLVLTLHPDATREELDIFCMQYENDEPIHLKSVDKPTFDQVKLWCDKYANVSVHLENEENQNPVLSEADKIFFQPFSNRALMDLLIAANYLEIPKLRLKIALIIRDKIRGVGPEEIRRIFAK